MAAYLLTTPSQQLANMPAPPPPNKARLLEGAARDPGQEEGHLNPQNKDHRCFMCSVLAHCLGVGGAHLAERKRTVSCLDSFFYQDDPRTPPSGLAARSGRRWGGLLWPADGPPRELRRHRRSTATPAPTVHIAQQPARQTVVSSCYVAVGRCGYVPPEELRLRLTHHERDSESTTQSAPCWTTFSLADHYLTWKRRRTRPVSMTRRRSAQGRHCRECLASFEDELRTAQNLGQHRGPDAQDHPCGLSQRGLRLPLPAALHRHDGLSCQQGAAQRARRGQQRRGQREQGGRKRQRAQRPMAKEAQCQGQAAPKPLTGWSAGRDQAGRLQPPLPPSSLQVGREVPADERAR